MFLQSSWICWPHLYDPGGVLRFSTDFGVENKISRFFWGGGVVGGGKGALTNNGILVDIEHDDVQMSSKNKTNKIIIYS